MDLRQLKAYVGCGLCCFALTACRSEEAAKPQAAKTVAAAAHAQSGDRFTISRKINAALPDFAFTLIGEKSITDGESFNVKRIEIRREAESSPFQIIEGLETETPRSAHMLEFQDMNFDGFSDMRIVQSRSAGPNVSYLNWVYDPESGKFAENRALNDIVSAEFDATSREIHSNWRDGATRYGKDIYVYRDGRPVLVRKEVKEYKAPKIYTLIKSELADGGWRTIEQHEIHEP